MNGIAYEKSDSGNRGRDVLLEVRELGIRFGGLKAVDNVSFRINRGEIVGIIGPNGAGKSTTFNMLAGALTPTSGKVVYEGREIQGKSPWEICKMGISRTFQKIKVFGDMTVLENAMVGALLHTSRVPAAREKAMEVLEQLGLHKVSGFKAKNLTLADRKKLELARALCNDPKLLLIDEMMCGLTQAETKDIMDLLIRLNKQGITMIVVEHIMAVIMKLSERLIVLDHGELIAEGTPEEVGRNEKVIKAYLGGHYAAS